MSQLLFYLTDRAGFLKTYSPATGNVTILEVAPPLSDPSGGVPDSLVLVGSNLYYTVDSGFPGEIRNYNISSNNDTLVANNFSLTLRDMALDAGNASVVVSDADNSRIARVILSNGTTTTLKTLTTPAGLAYDPSGNLFCLENSGHLLYKLNPSNGATIATCSFGANNTGDGLCYDTFSGLLWGVTSVNVGNQTLTSFNATTCTVVGHSVNYSANGSLDGVTSVGDGNIYVANLGAGQLLSYNISNNSWSTLVNTGIDDVLGTLVASNLATELYLWQIQALPDQVFNWRSQFISHGMNGYQHISRILATYSSTANVTLGFSVFDGVAPSSITLASTGGLPQRILLTLGSNKFRLIRYSANSSAPFQINLADWLVEVGEWGRSGKYVPYRLIGEG